MALPAIPIWTIKPNWRDGVTERLEWLTDVLDSNNGTEQRRALRLSPRRSFEMVFNPVDAERSYFGLFLHRLASFDFMLPIFHDKARLGAAVAATDTVLPFDNTYREFETGGYAIILRGTFSYEVVEITDQDDNGLTVEPIFGEWPAGTTVHPLRVARLTAESSTSALTSRVGRATLEFELNQANDYDEGGWTDLYAGYPLLWKAPNRREALDLSFIRRSDVLDNETGLTYLADEAGRAFTVQMHSWLIRGRQEHAEFRSMLYRLRGRQKAAWLPTFNNDLTLTRPVGAADTAIHVKEIGYAYTGGVVSGRDHVLFRNPGGDPVPLQISGIGAPLAAGEERLNLSAPVGAVLSAGLSGSFLEIGRLDQDRIEIFHATDTSGASECKTAFRSFLNERIEDELVAAPMPSGVMNALRCGDWSDRAICFALDRSTSMAGTRLATMKSAMADVLELLAGFTGGYVMDIGIVTFGDPAQSFTRRSADDADVAAVNTFVQGISAGANDTDFRAGMNAASAFFAGTSAGITDRYLFFVTDGEPTDQGDDSAATIVAGAVATRNAMNPVPKVFGINIVLADTSYTAMIDNTPEDGVPIVSETDSSGLIDAVLGAFA